MEAWELIKSLLLERCSIYYLEEKRINGSAFETNLEYF
jgi:hypothetical protein